VCACSGALSLQFRDGIESIKTQLAEKGKHKKTKESITNKVFTGKN
jgi:hypothetical protein